MIIRVEDEFEILLEKVEEFNRTDDQFRSIGSVLAQLKARLQNFGKNDSQAAISSHWRSVNSLCLVVSYLVI